MVIYIAGPMRGYRGFNWPAFDAAAERLSVAGHTVVNPAQLDRASGLDPNQPVSNDLVEYLMERDLALLVGCDAIYLLHGWQSSIGAKAEYEVANRHGLDIIEESYEPGTCRSA